MVMATHPRFSKINRSVQSTRAAAKAAVFLLKVLPMLPSRPLNWVTSTPIVEQLTYPTLTGVAHGDLYRPGTPGPHPGMVVCLGVVPFEVDHPQVPRLGEALARSGFAALLYWSPAMRDLRLDPADNENIALAYDALLRQPFVDPARSGLLGTCVGGSFALMAAASPRIRDRVAFVVSFAPYGSMWTLARDIASSSRLIGDARVPWEVDQLTRKVYIHSLTATLNPREGDLVQRAFSDSSVGPGPGALSAEGQAIYRLFRARTTDEADASLGQLPDSMQQLLAAMSPMSYLDDIEAPNIIIGHDRDDAVIPVSESRQLQLALSGRGNVHYTEFSMFQHMDPTKRGLSPIRLVRELGKFYRYLYPVFRCAVTT